jgi:hypothetical protein
MDSSRRESSNFEVSDSPYTYFEILNPSGSGKDSSTRQYLKFHQSSSAQGSLISKIYDRHAKGNIFSMMNPSSKAYIEFMNPAKTMMYHDCIVFQLQSFEDMNISLEFVIIDDKGLRKRVYISTSYQTFESNELHAKVPWCQPDRSIWTNLVFPLNHILSSCFPRSSMTKLESFQLKPCCKIRKVFLISHELLNLQDNDISTIKIPAALNFPHTIESQTILYQVMKQAPCSPKVKTLSSQTSVPEDIVKGLHQEFLKIGQSDKQKSAKLFADAKDPPIAANLTLLKKRTMKRSSAKAATDADDIRKSSEDELFSNDISFRADSKSELPPAPTPTTALSMRLSKTLQLAGQQSLNDDSFATERLSERSTKISQPPRPPSSYMKISPDLNEDDYAPTSALEPEDMEPKDSFDVTQYFDSRTNQMKEIFMKISDEVHLDRIDGIVEVINTLINIEIAYIEEYGFATYLADFPGDYSH